MVAARGAVGIQIELAFLDAVFHIAAGAIDVLVEVARRRLGTLQRGDDEARIGLALGPLGLGDDATPAAPTVDRAPLEVLEAARRLAALLGRCPRSDELRLDHGGPALGARQREHIIPARVFPP